MAATRPIAVLIIFQIHHSIRWRLLDVNTYYNTTYMDIFQSKLPVCVTIGLPRFTSRQAGTVIRAFPRNIVELTVITRRDARDIGRRGRMTKEDVPAAAGKREGCMSELRLIFFRAVIYCGIVLSRIRRLQPCQRGGGGGDGGGPPSSLSLSPFIIVAL